MPIIRTYGTCQLTHRGWEIEAEPQVLMRLRRHFPRVQNDFGVIVMKDTPEVCYELRWFMERYPLAMDEIDHFEDQADTYEQSMRDFHQVLSGNVDPRAFEMALPPREYQQVAADLWLRMGSLLLADDVGLGKQMPVDTKVLTPRGWVEIGTIRVGDEVIGSDGRPTRVTGVYPQGVRDNYRVSFSDGSSVEAGDEHLWTIRHRIGGRRFEDLTVTTRDLRTKAILTREHSNGRRTKLNLGKIQYLHLPMLTAPVTFAKQKPLPIPPYTLGALIGNGSLSSGRVVLTTHAEDAEEVRELLREDSIVVGVDESQEGLAHRFSCLGLTTQIRALGLNVLSSEKHIPVQYKTAAPADRVALLNGLMDADGSCSKTGNRLTYHTISSRLADDVVELVECLGGIATKRTYDREEEGKGIEYSVRIRVPATILPFRLTRKASRFAHTKGTSPRRTLTTIEYTRTVDSVCIRVAAADSLYVTERAILTHNTCTGICGLTDPATRPALIVTLTHLPSQWEAEINKFAPALRTHIIRKGKVYDIVNFGKRKKRVGSQLQLLDDVDSGDFPDVLICNYHKLAGWAETLSGLVKTVVYDECQELRHSGSQKHNAAIHISEKCDFRLGLSVGPNSKVLLKGGPFGNGWFGSVETAWGVLQQSSQEADVYSRGWENGEFAWKRVVSFMQHKCTSPYRNLSMGGAVTLGVTDCHSVFYADETGLHCAPSSELRAGTVLLQDNGRNWGGTEREVDVLEAATGLHRPQVVVDLSDVTREDLGVAKWQWQNFHREATYGTRLPLDVYKANAPSLPDPTLVYLGCGKAAALPPRLCISRFAYMIGFYLGDGWFSQKGRLCFAVEASLEKSFVAYLNNLNIGLRPKVRSMRGASVEVRCSNTLLVHVLRQWLGNSNKCFEKRIPTEAITTWPVSQREELLEGLIASDGHTSVVGTKQRVYYTTTSELLAHDLLLLLQSLGKRGSIHVTPPSAGGVVDGRRIIGRRCKYVVHWSPLTKNDSNYCGSRHSLEWTKGVAIERKVISSIPTEAPEHVYDLEMEGHPSFVADGVLVHNSATPIYNFGGEIHNVMAAVNPGALGTRDEFLKEWCYNLGGFSGDKHAINDPQAFGKYMRDSALMLRRTRADVKRELPPISNIPHTVDVDSRIIDSVADDAMSLARLILGEGGKGFDKMEASRELSWKLRQATGIAKAPYVAEFVKMLLSQNEKVLVYAWHREVYAILQERLREFNPRLFTGSESPAKKKAAAQSFTTGNCRVMLMSLRSGAGLDGLQKVCNTLVYAELDWSPGVHEQCLSYDTEILTPRGFVLPGHIRPGDRVAAFDVENEAVTWECVEHVTDRMLGPNEKMWGAATERVDILVTGQHRMVVSKYRRTKVGNKWGAWFIEHADSLGACARTSIPICGEQRQEKGIPLSAADMQLIGLYMSDGQLEKTHLVVHQQSEQEWNAEIERILNEAGYSYTLREREQGGYGATTMYGYAVPLIAEPRRWSCEAVKTALAMRKRGYTYRQIGEKLGKSAGAVGKKLRTNPRPDAHFVESARRVCSVLLPYLSKQLAGPLECSTKEQVCNLLYGLWLGDGRKTNKNKNTLCITSTNKVMVDRLQSLCVRRGISMRVSKRSTTTSSGTVVYDMWVSFDQRTVLPSSSKQNAWSQRPYSGKRVWCATNRLGTLIVRRRGKVAVVGNCTGRIARDGQDQPVFAYYLTSDTGSDPVVSESLGLKRQQVEGLRTPDGDLLEELQTDGNNIKKLAEAFIKQRKGK